MASSSSVISGSAGTDDASVARGGEASTFSNCSARDGVASIAMVMLKCGDRIGQDATRWSTKFTLQRLGQCGPAAARSARQGTRDCRRGVMLAATPMRRGHRFLSTYVSKYFKTDDASIREYLNRRKIVVKVRRSRAVTVAPFIPAQDTNEHFIARVCGLCDKPRKHNQDNQWKLYIR